MTTAISGIILAGGMSTRLGTDKALLDFGGKTLLENTIERLSEVTSDIVIACGAGTHPGWPDVRAQLVPDRHRGRGPLAGLDAGLRAITGDAAVVVACDMPFLNPDVLHHMTSLLEGYDAVVPIVGGRRHALHAVYARTCLPVIGELLLHRGSMRDLLDRVDARSLPESAIRTVDPDGLSCFNLNSPQDLKMARETWTREALPA